MYPWSSLLFPNLVAESMAYLVQQQIFFTILWPFIVYCRGLQGPWKKKRCCSRVGTVPTHWAGKQKKKKAKLMEHSKALVLVQKRCLNAVITAICGT